uniref:Abnormal spindle-like microcephaly-associated protein ASH domain-containing protein n=1 Tax=Lotharella globosa TaxID=91324 RepID=A0A7S4DEP7_9EUKA
MSDTVGSEGTSTGQKKCGTKNVMASASSVLGTKLVADSYNYVSPSPLEDGQVYVQIGGNKIFDIQPSVVHFRKFEVGEESVETIKVTNVSSKSQRMHILHPPASSPFSIEYPRKLGTMAPGTTQLIRVRITPEEWKYYQGNLKIHTSTNLVVPLHAYPKIGKINVPRFIDMGNTLVGEIVTRKFSLTCKSPVQFEYKIICLQYNPNFKISPLEGVIPPNSSTSFTISFTPTRQVTTRMSIKLEISQFGYKPMIATIVGSATELARPGDARNPCLTIDNVQESRLQRAGSIEEFETQARKTLHRITSVDGTDKPTFLRLQSGSEISRTAMRMQTSMFTPETIPGKPESEPEDEFLRGVKIPDRFHQTAVNSILTFEPGKMTIAEMKEAIQQQQELQKKREAEVNRSLASPSSSSQKKSKSHPTDYSYKPDVDVGFGGDTDQMREMIFLRKLKDYITHENKLSINPTRERIGQKLITNEQRSQILAKWQQDNKDAARRRREEGRTRSKHDLTLSAHERVVYPMERDVDPVVFNEVGQNDWESRQVALDVFKQTVWLSWCSHQFLIPVLVTGFDACSA